MAFEAGDVVYLKSGGPPMTVEWVGDHPLGIRCTWITPAGELKSQLILPVLLTKDPPSNPCG